MLGLAEYGCLALAYQAGFECLPLDTVRKEASVDAATTTHGEGPSAELLEVAERALTMSEQDLLARIGEVTYPDAGAAPPPLALAIEHGRRWLAEQRDKLRSAVCPNQTIRDVAESGDTRALLALVLPVLGVSATGDLVAFVAAWIVKQGIDDLCAENHGEP